MFFLKKISYITILISTIVMFLIACDDQTRNEEDYQFEGYVVSIEHMQDIDLKRALFNVLIVNGIEKEQAIEWDYKDVQLNEIEPKNVLFAIVEQPHDFIEVGDRVVAKWGSFGDTQISEHDYSVFSVDSVEVIE
ncbi:hypothetical protein M3202_15690 [Alkalihalobacillus oceani]|uniref:DUF3221 domain-containing protein n=1 Tax=Halalkalibacter oceani TaxID=1653776 RepID=A0A9X2DU22_9BACI|nr:hypothetical protein [Halalkalibacter oceani]MCM3715512.1 hypothetical protein [Halalkalibacter oceani]